MSVRDWTTYDDVAKTYGRLVLANGYAALAADLVAALNLPSAAAVLDVGCGTGAAATAAQTRIGARGFVAALDLSLAMVRCAALTGIRLRIVGSATRLPFRGGCFDAVTASLVLSHLDAYDQALREMARVLKPGGRLGVTAWAHGTAARSTAADAWMALAQSFVERQALDEALRRVVPHEGRLSDAAQLSAALAAADLHDVQVQLREYPIRIRVLDYLAMYDVFTYGRYLRATLGASRWREFRSQVEEKLHGVCGEWIEYQSRYHLALGQKRRSSRPQGDRIRDF